MQQTRLLLVEDDPDIREGLQALFESAGYAVDTAENGQIGLQRLRTGQLPRLILLDLLMPVMDGVEFRRQQLADPEIAHIPVVVCSAVHLDSTLARRLSVLAYFEKPVDITALLSAIRLLSK